MNDQSNPYAAADVTEQIEPLPVTAIVPASQGLRLVNLIIDQIAQIVLATAIGMLIIVAGGDQGDAFIDKTPDFVFSIVILLSYYIFFEATTSRTLGKVLTNTRVVNEEGGKPSFGQIVGRSFARLIPFDAFSFLGKIPRGWHDRFPKTYVIKNK